jgi:hypothetical protein
MGDIVHSQATGVKRYLIDYVTEVPMNTQATCRSPAWQTMH